MNILHGQFIGQEGGISGNRNTSHLTLRINGKKNNDQNVDINGNFLFKIKLMQVNVWLRHAIDKTINPQTIPAVALVHNSGCWR